MSGAGIQLLIDSSITRTSHLVVTEEGEYARSMDRLGAAGAHEGLEPRLLAEIFAYEVLERLRERDALGLTRGLLVLPFWPAAVFEACGAVAHAGGEIERLYPPILSASVVLRGWLSMGVACLRFIPLLRPDGARYVAALTREAVRRRWVWKDRTGTFPELMRHTASALIIQDGKLLLERRRADASSYPGFLDTPGGRLEKDESAESALAREMREELGIDAEDFFLAAIQDDEAPQSGGPYRHYVYRVTSWRGEIGAREGQTLMWIPLADVVQRTLPKEPPLNPLVTAALRECADRGWL